MTTKPDTYANCPQDIREKAAHIVANYGVDSAFLEGAIAAALNMERERCAQVADAEVWAPEDRQGASDIEWAGSEMAEHIAAAIRKGQGV